jgi:DNA-binding CsgD family transcriptional regulator
VAAAASRLAERNPQVTSLAAAAAHADGLARDDLPALRRAVHLFRSGPRPLERASALEDTARAEAKTGHRDRAVQLLEQAIEEAAGCGARRAVERMEKYLHGLGIPTEGGREPAGASPLALLTAAELGIARLTAQGLTNQQIATSIGRSPHTVDSHLRKIFQKLGVTTRVALTRLVVENDPGR